MSGIGVGSVPLSCAYLLGLFLGGRDHSGSKTSLLGLQLTVGILLRGSALVRRRGEASLGPKWTDFQLGMLGHNAFKVS